ncbi:MAG: hypothetical protein ACUVTR_02805 [Dehalococcoidia bacterium]
MGLMILPVTAAIAAMGMYIGSLLGFFLTCLAAMVSWMTALVCLVLVI